jgi:hypothetical protein
MTSFSIQMASFEFKLEIMDQLKVVATEKELVWFHQLKFSD